MKKMLKEDIAKVLHMFNLIAPIYVYHHADLMVKKEATRALSKLKRLDEEKNLFVGYFNIVELQGFESINTDGISDLVWTIYNDLFRFIIGDALPMWAFYIDEYGAYGFKDTDGQVQLLGDANGHFAYYLDSTELEQNIGSFRYHEQSKLKTNERMFNND